MEKVFKNSGFNKDYTRFANVILEKITELTGVYIDVTSEDSQELITSIQKICWLCSGKEVNGIQPNKGMFLAGTPGTGKTTLMKAFINALREVTTVKNNSNHFSIVNGRRFEDGGVFLTTDMYKKFLSQPDKFKIKVSNSNLDIINKYLHSSIGRNTIINGLYYYKDGSIDVSSSKSNLSEYNNPFSYDKRSCLPVFVEASRIREEFVSHSYEGIRKYYDSEVEGFTPFLIIDDLFFGFTSETVKSFGTTENPVYYVLTRRANFNLMTFATSNILPDTNNSAFISRLAGMFNFVKLNGKDHRH